MALPTNISYGTVVGQFLAALQDGSDPDKLPEGVPMKGTVTFIASPTYVLDYTATPNPVTILKTPIICPLDENGYVCSPYVAADSPLSPGVTLIATDDPDILPIGWTWTVMYALTDPLGRAVSLPNQNISVPAGTETDLTTAMNIAAANGVIITKGPQGEIGPIGPYGVPVTLTVGEVETGPETPGSIGPQGMKGEPGGFTLAATINSGVDLDTIVVPGIYRINFANATLALHYPKDAMGGEMLVTSDAATRVVQTVLPISTTNRGMWQRNLNSATWTAWQFISSQRVDQTAGRAIYTWDDLNNREQRIYGDTGWRDVTSLLVNGWASPAGLLMRRVNDVVTINGIINVAAATTDHFLSLNATNGFIPYPPNIYSIVLSQDYTASRDLMYDSAAGVKQIYVRSGMGKDWRINASWMTHDAWPTALPGTAVGTIPNL